MSKFNAYGTQAVFPLSEDHFSLDESDSILSLKDIKDGIWIVLFYDDTPRSERLLEGWNRIAQKIAGVKMASCDITIATNIPIVLGTVTENHALYGMSIRWPLFILYEDGLPVGRYRGDYDEEEILNWTCAISMLA